MAGLVRADTELMLAAAAEMQRVSQVMLDQFAGAQRAMQDLQGSWWHGTHRQVIEDQWLTLAFQFEPAAATLQKLSVRLKRTASALEAAALLFAEPVATPTTGSAPAYLRWMTEMLDPSALMRLGLSPGNPAAMLEFMLGTPLGRALVARAREAYEPHQAAVDTSLPSDGPPPRIFIINGIDSDAVAGAPDKDALLLEQRLEEFGYRPEDVETTAAVFNTNLGTQLRGTDFGGYLSPLDGLTGMGASVINTVTGGGNQAVGTAQVLGEYVFGEQGFYTRQTVDDIQSKLAANPLVEGQEIMIISHSGGGAIAPWVAQSLHRSGYTTAGLVTMGSPVSNRDQASQYARQVVELRDQRDLIGLPILRSAEGRVTSILALSGVMPLGLALAQEAASQDVRPNMTRVATNSGETNVVNAHVSYWTSDEVMDVVQANFPAVANALHRRHPEPAKP